MKNTLIRALPILALLLGLGHSLAAATANAATLSASPTSVAPGASLTATWNAITTPTATDWIGLYASGASNTAYLTYQYTNGSASGSISSYSIPAGAAAGTYELRLFAHNGYTLLATSNSFTVAGSPLPPTLSASPTSVPPGGTPITATWTGIPAPSVSDWIGLYTPGAANSAYLAYVYTHTSAFDSGATPFPISSGTTAGTYQLRLFAWNGSTPLATSNNFTVGTTTSSTLFYIHADHLNTPRLIANQSQQTVWRWDNDDPFGANMANANPSGLGTFTFNLRLPGQYFDPETNYHYNYHRDYSPEIGRYVESDPIGIEGGVNTYTYVDASPLSWVDNGGTAKKKAGGKSEPAPIPVTRGLSRDTDKVYGVVTGIPIAGGASRGGGRIRLLCPSPAQSAVWKGFQNYREGIRTNGQHGKDRQYYDWDYTHGDIEVYDRIGNHLGSMDPNTGQIYKPAVPGRVLSNL
jgi:RHS repeat-associated protein